MIFPIVNETTPPREAVTPDPFIAPLYMRPAHEVELPPSRTLAGQPDRRLLPAPPAGS